MLLYIFWMKNFIEICSPESINITMAFMIGSNNGLAHLKATSQYHLRPCLLAHFWGIRLKLLQNVHQYANRLQRVNFMICIIYSKYIIMEHCKGFASTQCHDCLTQETRCFGVMYQNRAGIGPMLKTLA